MKSFISLILNSKEIVFLLASFVNFVYLLHIYFAFSWFFFRSNVFTSLAYLCEFTQSNNLHVFYKKNLCWFEIPISYKFISFYKFIFDLILCAFNLYISIAFMLYLNNVVLDLIMLYLIWLCCTWFDYVVLELCCT